MYKKLLVNTLFICGLGLASVVHAIEQVNLYSVRKEVLIKPILDEFTKQTGIKVNIIAGKADNLFKQLKSEGQHSPADILLTTDVSRLHRAKEANLLQPIKSTILNAAVPESYRDPDNQWYGLSLRARVIIYAKDRIKPEWLSSYEDLQHKKWYKRVCIRSASNIYNQSLVASIIAANGKEKAEMWVHNFVKNLANIPAGGDQTQIKAVAVGLCDVAVVNTYYLGSMLNADQRQRSMAQKIAIFWPNQANRGAHVNISGAGITQSAKNKANAIKLLEFLVSKSAQKWYAEVNYEFPIREDLPSCNRLQTWGAFKADTIELSKLGELNSVALNLMNQAGWY